MISRRNDFVTVTSIGDGPKSTIVVSQLPVKDWYNLFENATFAEAILDRLMHQAYSLR